jgi:hypothetical protein
LHPLVGHLLSGVELGGKGIARKPFSAKDPDVGEAFHEGASNDIKDVLPPGVVAAALAAGPS